MTHFTFRVSTLALAAAGTLSLTHATHAQTAQPLIGLTVQQTLVNFNSDNPGLPTSVVPLTRVGGTFGVLGESMRGIDLRPADGLLYGVSVQSNQGRLYQIDPLTGVSTRIGEQFAVPLGSTLLGIDFNPTVDRLRVVTTQGLNLRVNPNTGAVVDGNPDMDGVQPDGPLAFAPGDPEAGNLPSVTATAYSNNQPGATSTTQFAISHRSDSLLIVNPPNEGTLTTVGPLDAGFDVFTQIGFDISGVDGTAFASLRSFSGDNAAASLFTIDLATGAASRIGTIGLQVGGTTTGQLSDLTVAVIPEPGTLALGVLAAPLLLRRRRA